CGTQSNKGLKIGPLDLSITAQGGHSNSRYPNPSGWIAVEAGADQDWKPTPGTVRWMPRAQAVRVLGGVPVSSRSGMAASMVQAWSTPAAATNHSGFQVEQPQHESAVQPRSSTASR